MANIRRLPSYIAEDTVTLATTYKYRAFRNAVHSNKTTVVGLAEDYLAELETALENAEIVLDYSNGNIPIAEVEKQVWDNLNAFLSYRDEYIEFLHFTCQYIDHSRVSEAVQVFFSHCCRFVHRNEHGNKRFADNYQFLVGELFLYTVATLVKKERFDDANIFLASLYRDSEDYSGETYSYSTFVPFMNMLEQKMQRHGSHMWGGLTFTKLQERANHKKTTWEDLVNADYILFLRGFINMSTQRSWWSIMLSSGHILPEMHGGLAVFRLAESKAYFNKFCILLSVDNKAELEEKLNMAFSNPQRARDFTRQNLAIHKELMQFDNLATH